MKKNIALLFILSTITLTLVGSQIVMAQSSDLTAPAKRFITLLSGEDYKTAVSMFDDTMKKFLPEDKLKETWQSLQTQFGSFKAQGSVRKEKIQNYDAVYINCQFEKSSLDSRIVFNSNGMIAGLQFIPSISK